MGESSNLISGNSFLWLLVIGIIIAAIVILVMSRRDDNESAAEQQKNDRNLLPWVVGVGAVILVVGLAYYYGLFESGKEVSGATIAIGAMGSTRGKSPQQVNQERLAQSAARSASRSPSRSPTKTSGRSPARGSLSATSE